MARFEPIGRRAWLGRMAGGMVGVWAGINAGSGREGWAGWLGWAPRSAAAQAGAAQIHPVEMDMEFEGTVFTVAAFVIVRGREIAIVDSLIPGNADRIGAMIRQAGFDWRAVRHVILTHFHFDHTGSAEEIAALAPQASFWAGEPDIPEIQLSRTVNPVYDRDEVFGLQIVSTPGHTPGHVAVLDTLGSTLMTGDALFNMGGQLGLPPAAFTQDLQAALASAGKLGALGFERALFAHGPSIDRGASQRIAELAAQGRALGDPSALVDHRHNCLLHA
jgi:glyoxylase-like metal-dependent hydrolase (beta-lactamase superfamily II)